MPDKKSYEKRLQALKNEWSSWGSHCKELNEFYLPRKGRFLEASPNRGEKVNQSIIDNAGTHAARTLAAGMMGADTSASNPWFSLATPDPEMMEHAGIRDWIYDFERVIYDICAKSNLYTALPSVYIEQAVYGQCPLFVEEDTRTTIWCTPFTIGSYYLANNAQGRIDTIYREFHMTVRQIVSQFGIGNCSPNVKSLWDTKNTEQWIKIVHLIEPNEERNTNYLDNQNFPVRSAWYESGSNHDALLRKSGFYEQPFMCPRWDAVAGDVYGSSPGMDCLGMVKALQLQQKRKAQAIDKHLDPPLQVPSMLAGKPVFTTPGGRNAVDAATGMQGMRPVYEVKPDMQGLNLDILDLRQQINEGFFVDLFLMLAMSDRRQVTAEEIARRHEEKLMVLAPVMERQNSELKNPLIDRIANIAMRSGRVPPPPKELEGVNLKVQYISVLAKAQRMVGLSSVDRLWQFAGTVSQFKPDVMDKLDADQSVDEYAQMLGTPPGVVKSDEEVESFRKAKAEQMEIQQAAQAMPDAAKTAKDLSQAKLQSGASVLDQLSQQGA